MQFSYHLCIILTMEKETTNKTLCRRLEEREREKEACRVGMMCFWRTVLWSMEQVRNDEWWYVIASQLVWTNVNITSTKFTNNTYGIGRSSSFEADVGIVGDTIVSIINRRHKEEDNPSATATALLEIDGLYFALYFSRWALQCWISSLTLVVSWKQQNIVSGLVICPGFIDVHTHDDRAVVSLLCYYRLYILPLLSD